MTAPPVEWRPCPGFSDYEVSSCGEVRRASHATTQPGRVLRGVIDADGNIRFHMVRDDGEKKNRGAHQLVAEAFLGAAPSPHHQVAHQNGSRVLNIPSNLAWKLYEENEADREVHGTRPKGERNPRAKITEDDVRYIRRRYRELKLTRGSVAELDNRFGLHRSTIISIAKGETWAHVR